jgi:hypothetical protein
MCGSEPSHVFNGLVKAETHKEYKEHRAKVWRNFMAAAVRKKYSANDYIPSSRRTSYPVPGGDETP